MAKVNAIPEGYPQVIPYLYVDGAAAAIDFYGKVIGTKERMRMGGYPGVAGLDAAGHQVAQAQRTPHGFLQGGLPPGQTAPPVIDLAPGQTASASIESINGNGDCPSHVALLVTPPGETHAVRVDIHIYPCMLEVHPVVPGPNG